VTSRCLLRQGMWWSGPTVQLGCHPRGHFQLPNILGRSFLSSLVPTECSFVEKQQTIAWSVEILRQTSVGVGSFAALLHSLNDSLLGFVHGCIASNEDLVDLGFHGTSVVNLPKVSLDAPMPLCDRLLLASFKRQRCRRHLAN